MKQWLKTICLLILTGGILLALFTIGLTVALLLLGAGMIASLYLWLRNKGIVTPSSLHKDDRIIEADYEVVEKDDLPPNSTKM